MDGRGADEEHDAEAIRGDGRVEESESAAPLGQDAPLHPSPSQISSTEECQHSSDGGGNGDNDRA